MIRNYHDFCTELLTAGFSFAGGSDEGIFSLLKQDAAGQRLGDQIQWFTGDADTDPWLWRVRVLEERDDIAYGKVFCRKGGYITKAWYPRFLAVRRNGRSFDAFYNDGLISRPAKQIYELLRGGEGIAAHELKQRGEFCKENKNQFERALVQLQTGLFITACGRQQKIYGNLFATVNAAAFRSVIPSKNSLYFAIVSATIGSISFAIILATGRGIHLADTQMRRYVGTKENVIYGIANGGQVMGYGFLTSYLTYFFINVFHINPKFVSAMLFVEGIWDTVNDPLMGSIVDRTRTRYGKLRPYLLAVPIPLAITTLALFSGPLIINSASQNAPSKLIYVTIAYFLWEFFYTIGDVPFWGMSAAISPNPDDRTRAITSARFISGIFGGIPGIAMPILLDVAASSAISLKNVFFVLALLASTVGIGLFSLSGIFAKERVVQNSDEPSFRECIEQIAKNPPLRLLILKDVLGAFAGIGGIYGTYYFVDVLGSASIQLLIGLPGTIIGFAAYLLVPIAKKHFSNKQLVIISPFISSALNLLVYLAGLHRYSNMKVMVPLLMLNSALPSFLNGINSVVPTEMIGETVDYMEWTTGQRSEGISFSVLTFVSKFSGSLSRSLGTLTLPWAGYKTAHNNAFVQQSVATKNKIWFMYMASPILLRLIGIIPMFFYDLVGEKRERMLSELAVRRKQLAREVSGGGVSSAGASSEATP